MIDFFRCRAASICGSLATSLLALLPLGCGEDDAWPRPTQVEVALADLQPTVVRVSWHTDAPSVGYVEYGTDSAMALSTAFEVTPATEHSQLLLGLTADTAYSLRVVTWDGKQAGAGDVESVRTGVPSEKVPAFAASGHGFEGFAVEALRGERAGVALIDAAGAIVWYHAETSGKQPLRARLSADKTSILYNLQATEADSSPDSQLIRVMLDGSPGAALELGLPVRDFLELPDGKLAALVDDEHGDGVRSADIVELGDHGVITHVWSATDCFDPSEINSDAPGSAWLDANALDYVDAKDKAARAYYVGLAGFSSIVKVRPETGECDWVLGTLGKSLDFEPGATPFLHQSGFDAYGNRVLVFDSREAGDVSRVVEYEIDADAATATELGSYAAEDASYAGEVGSVTRQVDGGWLIGWGDAGRLELVQKGNSVWSVDGGGASFGYHSLADTLYLGDSRKP